MAVKIKLKRMGKIRAPQYRIVVADSRTKRDGRAIEEIGKYHPKEDPSLIEVRSERVQYWLGVGAQPTEPVLALLKVTGDWQKFRGEPGAEGTLRTKPPRTDRRAAFDAALAEAHGESRAEATTPRKRAAKKAEPAAAAETRAPAETAAPAKAAAPAEAADAAGASAVTEGAMAPEAAEAPEEAAAEAPAEPAGEAPAEQQPEA